MSSHYDVYSIYDLHDFIDLQDLHDLHNLSDLQDLYKLYINMWNVGLPTSITITFVGQNDMDDVFVRPYMKYRARTLHSICSLYICPWKFQELWLVDAVHEGYPTHALIGQAKLETKPIL